MTQHFNNITGLEYIAVDYVMDECFGNNVISGSFTIEEAKTNENIQKYITIEEIEALESGYADYIIWRRDGCERKIFEL